MDLLYGFQDLIHTATTAAEKMTGDLPTKQNKIYHQGAHEIMNKMSSGNHILKLNQHLLC